MIRILFVCLGNICRSPMAEFVFKDIVKSKGLENRFVIESAATSNYEIGNPVHHGTRDKLALYGISVAGKTARRMTKADYNKFDYILGMENSNIHDILKIIGTDPDKKVHRLLDYSDNPRDIADPWFTGNFDVSYNDIYEGCTAFFNYLLTQKNGLLPK